MPTIKENLIEAVNLRKYQEAFRLIKTNPDLVNSVKNENGYSLLQLALSGSKPGDESQPFIEYLVVHPNFDFNYKQNNETNLDSIISSARVDVLKLIINDPKILFKDNQLAYEVAKVNLVSAQKALQRNLKKNPNSKSSARGIIEVANLEEIVSMLRDATILHAMKTDNANLLTQLDKAGGEPTDFLGKLGNKQLPNMLVKPENKNIISWFKARSEQSMKNYVSNPNSFHNRINEAERLKSKLAELDKKHVQARAEVNKQGLNSLSETIEGMLSSLR